MRAMKDSGTEWIGEIPEDWVTIKAKYIIAENDGGIWGNDPQEVELSKIVIRSTEQTIDGKWDISNPAYRDLSNENYHQYLIRPGDLLITKSSGSKLHIGKTTLADDYFITHECYYSNFLQRIRVKETCHPKYIWYLLNSNITRQQFVYRQNSTSGIGNINSSDIENIYIPLPSFEKQSKIIAFLDQKCAEIDTLTSDIETQIETMEQYKRSVITEAVTKGLDPDAERKDNGRDWLGLIPKAWILQKGKYIFRQRNERGNDFSLELLSPTQRYGVIPQTMYEELTGASAVKLSEKADLAQLKTIHKGDFCISLRSFQGGFEYSVYEGVVSPAYQVFFPIVDIADGYYKYLFKERSFIEKMNSYTLTLRDGKNIAFSDFGNTYIPYPPVMEQKKIADFLDRKCAEIDSIIADRRTQIDTLASYKKSLIYEYVTGKKEVPSA